MEKYNSIFGFHPAHKVKSSYESSRSLDFIQLTNVLLTKKNMEKGMS
jgi:hypothetical protein